jgi:capsular polysaccharide biosynthesis protein
MYKQSLIQNKIVKVIDIKSWSQMHCTKMTVLDINRKVYVQEPNIVAEDDTLYSFPYGEAELPEVYLAKLHNVTVIEGSDLVMTDTQTALYDEIALDKEGKYELREGIVALIHERNTEKGEVTLTYRKSFRRLPKRAIHFCKDYSYNYFHWIIEALPRMWIVEQFKELDALPLLVDSHLKSQQIESLRILTENKREIIPLQLGQGYKIKHLFYPSGLSYVHNNYDHPFAHDKDLLVSPLAVSYLRNRFLPIINAEQNHVQGQSKKIYLSRKKLSQGQRLLNTDEIEIMLLEKGFDIIHPELLSFTDQIRLFSQAEIIVGASGSAFANLVFAKENCKVFILHCNNRFTPYLFDMIANSVNCSVCNVIGKEQLVEGDHDHSAVHNPFVVNIKTLALALDH